MAENGMWNTDLKHSFQANPFAQQQQQPQQWQRPPQQQPNPYAQQQQQQQQQRYYQQQQQQQAGVPPQQLRSASVAHAGLAPQQQQQRSSSVPYGQIPNNPFLPQQPFQQQPPQPQLDHTSLTAFQSKSLNAFSLSATGAPATAPRPQTNGHLASDFSRQLSMGQQQQQQR
eukprot:CAMPEP_0118911936 /NCGR_PEP_ID=MMETSP1166-20130328/13411_1 /TAXON_ID=1104430 /ORGANISM="Chrysoreinhardia sp, Strain CCMP3193" /LENGTH=170 /DNA_ID=CAMNT_0006851449 /DNA_START=39 /DNA_END=548 /DNA_ORIENTATION=+